MSTTWPEGLDSEYDEYDDAEYDDTEYDDGEYDDAESRASKRRKRQRKARQVAQARARATQGRGAGRLPATRNAAQQAAAAVRDLDLETKVVRDDFRSSDRKQSKRMSRSEYATVASILINQGLQTFGRPDNEILLAAIQASPLLLLAPERKGSGIEAVVKDPRFLGLAGVAGLVTFNELRERSATVKKVEIQGPKDLPQGVPTPFQARVLESRDRPSDKRPVWASENPAIVTIDPTTGVATGQEFGKTTVITARVDDVVDFHIVEVIRGPVGTEPAETKPTDAKK